MRTPCCHTCLAFILKFLNFLQTFIGLSIIIYSIYMLNHWHNHSQVLPPSAPTPDFADSMLLNANRDSRFPDHIGSLNFVADIVYGLGDGVKSGFHNLPAPWFIYAFMGVGIVVCCVTFIGHIAAEAISGCCLCFYALLTTVLVLMEAALVAFIGLDRNWDEVLPVDPTGELDNLRGFIKENVDICKWVGIAVLIIQALSLLLAIILRAMVSTRGGEEQDVEGDYDSRGSRQREPLINPQQPSGSIKGDGRLVSDVWSSRIRDKYGLNNADNKYNYSNPNASVEVKTK